MPKPDLSTIPHFYRRYVSLIDEDNATRALARNTESLFSLLNSVSDDKWDYRYAEGKWSIREMVQHMIDAERIFAYRALCIARGEKGSLPGFDENAYADASRAGSRQKEDLLKEFEVVRKSTEMLFRSFDEEQLAETGTANNHPVSVNAIGYLTAGHAAHHLNILREKYLVK